MRNQPRGSSPKKAPCCLYSGRISRRTGSSDSISQPSAKAWRNSDCATRRGPSIPGVASLKQSRNRRAPGLRTFSSPVRCRANNSQAGFRAPDETCLHTCSSNLYLKVQPTLHAIAGSCSSFVTSLYLFSVSECINKLSFFCSPSGKRFECCPVTISLQKLEIVPVSTVR